MRDAHPCQAACPWFVARAVLVAGLLVLGACATRPPAAPLPAISGDARSHQQSRETALAAMPDWALQGRVALSNGKQGGSGRIDWQQDGAGYEVALSAPVTRQSWRLRGAPGAEVVLEGLDGGPRSGADAQALLLDATGWDIPVSALASWVRGVPAPEAAQGAAALAFGDDGRLATLSQGGWTITYGDWRPAGANVVELPHRLNAARGAAHVRLVVDQWQPGG